MDDRKLAALIRKNQAKAQKLAKVRDGRQFDATLNTKPETDARDLEREKLFKELKRRDF
jgi:hypothetical protein